MALNIKNAEVESLAAEVAKLADEIQNRSDPGRPQGTSLSAEVVSREALSQRAHRRCPGAHFREQFPNADYGRRLTKEEEERILGFGPDGV